MSKHGRLKASSGEEKNHHLPKMGSLGTIAGGGSFYIRSSKWSWLPPKSGPLSPAILLIIWAPGTLPGKCLSLP